MSRSARHENFGWIICFLELSGSEFPVSQHPRRLCVTSGVAKTHLIPILKARFFRKGLKRLKRVLPKWNVSSLVVDFLTNIKKSN